MERLREGLFDPVGVKSLTCGKATLDQVFDKGAKVLEKTGSFHQCILGTYGQGKSHTLNYIRQRALDQGFVVSYINLDPRQVPFYNFKEVYGALMKAMVFPGRDKEFIDAWKTRASKCLALPENSKKTCQDLIPEKIPHRFKAILTALVHKTIVLTPGKRKLKKHRRFKPREFPWILKNALMGKDIPVWRLRAALHYRQVPFYKEKSLVCKTPYQYLDLITGMAELFRIIGFKGWVVLFDEGESIVQTRITSRSKSYRLLDRIFCPEEPLKGFYPVFAFTHDFFTRVADEPYDRLKPKKDKPYFDKNYSTAWQEIHVHNLNHLSSKEWKSLIHKLVQVHARAYQWQPPVDVMAKKLNLELSKYNGAEPRLKLKLLVNRLDLAQQHLME